MKIFQIAVSASKMIADFQRFTGFRAPETLPARPSKACPGGQAGEHRRKMQFMRSALFFYLLIGCFGLVAQDTYPYPSLSPKGKISQVVGNTLIEVEYERPSARGRKIFGGLVPWNKVWRTGAGHCTKLSFNQTVYFGGQPVPRGTYSLFTIPSPDQWIVILNTDTTLYGSYKYDHLKDVARFTLQPKSSARFYEALTIDIDILPNNARMYISWADTQIDFEIQTSTDEKIGRFIQEELLTGKHQDADIYAGAADYFFFQGNNLKEALTLADKAVELDPNNGWAVRIKIEIYEKLQLYNEALVEIDRAIEITKRREYDDEKYRMEDIGHLKDRSQHLKELRKSSRP